MKNFRFALVIMFLESLALSLTTCAGPLALNGIIVTPANPSIAVGATQQFTATGYYNDQTSRNISTEVTWSSSNTSVATIDSSGLATGLSPGTTTITVISPVPSSFSSSSSSASTTLIVTSGILSSLSVTPANANIPAGVTQQFAVTATYSDGTSYDITTQVICSSSDTSVATIDSRGLATTVATGVTTVTAASGIFSGSTALNVNSATLSSIFVTLANPTIPAGATQQFTATGNYSDGTSYDITTQVTWSSSDTLVATIDSSGLATAVDAGTASITATSGAISGSTILTVTSS